MEDKYEQYIRESAENDGILMQGEFVTGLDKAMTAGAITEAEFKELFNNLDAISKRNNDVAVWNDNKTLNLGAALRVIHSDVIGLDTKPLEQGIPGAYQHLLERTRTLANPESVKEQAPEVPEQEPPQPQSQRVDPTFQTLVANVPLAEDVTFQAHESEIVPPLVENHSAKQTELPNLP